jgi:hypothetical protein
MGTGGLGRAGAGDSFLLRPGLDDADSSRDALGPIESPRIISRTLDAR